MRAWVCLLFFFSGLTGLLYEVVWIRAAGTVLGNSTAAVGTVVGVYMAGLALGARFGGRAADRRSGLALLRFYGLVEAGVAVGALLVPFVLDAAAPLFRGFPLRVALVVAVLAVPSILMGATLPILARFLAPQASSSAAAAGTAYALNTFGGVAGTLAAGFWLLPTLGLRSTTLLATTANAALAGAALWMSRGGAGALEPAVASTSSVPRPVQLLVAVSGFAALVYEVAWTRLIVLAVGSTVYSFTIVLAVFIFGLAAGSALGARFVDRARSPAIGLAGLQLGIGLLALATLPLLAELPVYFGGVMEALQKGYDVLLLAQAGLTAALLLPPTLLMGAVFPLACRWAAPAEGEVGRRVAAVYSWNTLGAIAGSLVATFILLPAAGPGVAVKGAVALNLLAAAVLFLQSGSRGLLALPAAGLAGLLLIGPLDARLLSSGAYLYGSTTRREAGQSGVSVRRHLESVELVDSAWDAYGLVTVHRIGAGGDLAMRINGKVDASTWQGDMTTQQLLAHLPLLQHPAPRRVLVVGLGAGVTAGVAAGYDVERVDCVELSPAVAAAARHFAAFNGDVLRNPKLRLTIGDGRRFIQGSAELYDAIICEPSNLWLSGMATLFTQEFFREAAGRLAPGGVFCQWIHGYRLSADDFRSVLRTFYSVFPGGGVWELQPAGDYLLLGTTEKRKTAWPGFAARAQEKAELHRELRDLFHPAGVSLAGAFVADAAAVKAATGDGDRLSDDLSRIEYTAPRSVYAGDRPGILRWLDGLRGPDMDFFEGLAGQTKAAVEKRRAGRRAVAAAMIPFMGPEPADPGPQRFDSRSADSLKALDAALAAFGPDRVSRRLYDERAQDVMSEGLASLKANQGSTAARYFEAIPPGTGPYTTARQHLGELRLAARDAAGAREAFLDARRESPRALNPVIGWATSCELLGKDEEALEAWGQAAALDPRRPEFWAARARLFAKLGRREEALASCRKALELKPEDPALQALLRSLSP